MSNAAKEYLLEISRLCESTECAVEKVCATFEKYINVCLSDKYRITVGAVAKPLLK